MPYFPGDPAPPNADMPAPIAQAVIDVMGNIGRLTKAGRNAHDGYNYVSIDGVLEATNPLCAAAGLIVKPVMIRSERFEAPGKTGVRRMLRMFFKFRLVHASGVSWTDPDELREVEVQATGAQGFGSAESYAQKQYFKSLFQIATGDKDEDATEKLETEVLKAKVATAQKRRETGDAMVTFDVGNGHEPVALADLQQLCRAHIATLGTADEIEHWFDSNKDGRTTLYASDKTKPLALALRKDVETAVASLRPVGPAAKARPNGNGNGKLKPVEDEELKGLL
jgi:ERF superfamily